MTLSLMAPTTSKYTIKFRHCSALLNVLNNALHARENKVSRKIYDPNRHKEN